MEWAPNSELSALITSLESSVNNLLGELDTDTANFYRETLEGTVGALRRAVANVVTSVVAPGAVAMTQDKLAAFLAPSELYTLLDIRTNPEMRDSDYARGIAHLSDDRLMATFQTDADREVYHGLRELGDFLELTARKNRQISVNRDYFDVVKTLHEVVPLMIKQFNQIVAESGTLRDRISALATTLTEKMVEVQRLQNTVAKYKRELRKLAEK